MLETNLPNMNIFEIWAPFPVVPFSEMKSQFFLVHQ